MTISSPTKTCAASCWRRPTRSLDPNGLACGPARWTGRAGVGSRRIVARCPRKPSFLSARREMPTSRVSRRTMPVSSPSSRTSWSTRVGIRRRNQGVWREHCCLTCCPMTPGALRPSRQWPDTHRRCRRCLPGCPHKREGDGDKVGPHGDLLAEFPYWGRRTMSLEHLCRCRFDGGPQIGGSRAAKDRNQARIRAAKDRHQARIRSLDIVVQDGRCVSKRKPTHCNAPSRASACRSAITASRRPVTAWQGASAPLTHLLHCQHPQILRIRFAQNGGEMVLRHVGCPIVDPGFSRTEVFAMIYELRVYQPVPGQMPKLLARFRDKLLPIWERHGIRPIGFWTTLVGELKQ